MLTVNSASSVSNFHATVSDLKGACNVKHKEYVKLCSALEEAGFKFNRPKSYSKTGYNILDSEAGPMWADFHKNKFYIGYDHHTYCCIVRAEEEGEEAALRVLAEYVHTEACDKAYALARTKPADENIAKLVELIKNTPK